MTCPPQQLKLCVNGFPFTKHHDETGCCEVFECQCKYHSSRIPEICVMFRWASRKISLCGQHLYYVHINSVGCMEKKSHLKYWLLRASKRANFSLSNWLFQLSLKASKRVKTSLYLQEAQKPSLRPVTLSSRYLQWMGKRALCDF